MDNNVAFAIAASRFAPLLPDAVVCVEMTGASAGEGLHPEELAYIQSARASRRLEFATGRTCARTALERAGCINATIGRADTGAPVFPQGFVGSITHGPAIVAAAAACSGCIAAIGLDAESCDAVSEADLKYFAADEERRVVEALRDQFPASPWATVLFSAKESAFKAFSACRKPVPTFRDALVYPTATGRFRVSHPAGAGESFDGRWAVDGHLVLTACWAPNRAGLELHTCPSHW